jgi:uncharacterized protein
MAKRIIDIRNRPAFLHDFYGARRDSSEFAAAKWLNGRTGSKEPEHFSRSQTEAGYLEEIRSAGVVLAVVIGRDTPAIKNDNDQIARLVARHPQLTGVGSVDPDRLGVAGAVAEAERAVKTLGLKAINVEPGFGALYVEAANGALSDQIAFGSSYPFRAMAQSIEDYERLGFRDEVREKVFFSNATRLLNL